MLQKRKLKLGERGYLVQVTWPGAELGLEPSSAQLRRLALQFYRSDFTQTLTPLGVQPCARNPRDKHSGSCDSYHLSTNMQGREGSNEHRKIHAEF